jgi:hypothetical protein
MENDSDDMGIGYDSCSSDDIGQMMLRMEQLEMAGSQDDPNESFSMQEIGDE